MITLSKSAPLRNRDVPRATWEPPIFADLLAKHGDVLTEAREAAHEVQREAATALDFSDLYREEAD